jgi:hypothetical protein
MTITQPVADVDAQGARRAGCAQARADADVDLER